MNAPATPCRAAAVLVLLALGCGQKPLEEPGAIVVNGQDAAVDRGAPPSPSAMVPEETPIASRSCIGLAPTCGPHGDGDCCQSSPIPGGTFNRSNDARYPATVSDFRLDKYEITVGRFRKFLAAYRRDLIGPGAGKNPNDPMDFGWSDSWNPTLPDGSVLIAGLEMNTYQQTWTHEPGANENLPMNDISWPQAFAFCIWDGGRLPSEAEWNYAAAGGNEQRQFPWSSPPGNVVFDATFISVPTPLDAGGNQTARSLLPPVGSSSPQGDGRWGQSDLAGSVREWTADTFSDTYVVPCHDCSPKDYSARFMTIRPSQGDEHPATRDAYSGVPYRVGARCAR